jgi:hypothetical protein
MSNQSSLLYLLRYSRLYPCTYYILLALCDSLFLGETREIGR